MGTEIQRNFDVQATGLILVKNLPITVTPNESFTEAKRQLQEMVAAGIATIQSDEDYALATDQFDKINKFLKNLEKGIKGAKDELNAAKTQLMAFIHELDEPATKLQQALAKERARYSRWKEEQIEAERLRKEEEARQEAARLQRQVDTMTLMDEIEVANEEAQAALVRGQEITSKEIIEILPGDLTKIVNLIGTANMIRHEVAAAKQREATRIAMAEAKNKREREAIAKQAVTVPMVEAVQATKVEAAPVVVMEEPALPKLKGEKTITYWRVRQDERGKTVGITKPHLVPRQYCEPSVSLLNEYAKSCQDRPDVFGVEFEEVNKTSAFGK
jgi:predicted DNA-binding protein (UPF0251 family)